jgi:Outer membrane protein beta-barrel domain
MIRFMVDNVIFPQKTRFLQLGAVWVAACALVASGGVFAQDGGYFSGIRLGSGAKSGAWSFAAPGLKLGQALEYSRNTEFSTPTSQFSTAFGGYQFGSGVALGAALSSTENRGAADANSGVGIRFDGARWSETRNSTVNLDVVSAFNFRNSLSVYGKVGVGRSETRAFDPALIGVATPDKTAISYGLGVRYDLTPSLGLKFELLRGTKFGIDRLRTESDPDSINFGLRWTF